MKIKNLLLGSCFLCGATAMAQTVDVQPQPQLVKLTEQVITLPSTYQLIGENEANPHAVSALKRLLGNKQTGKNGISIYIGEKGDKSVRPFARMIPNHAEGYYLAVDNKQIVVAGNDARGTFYAMQTLAQLLKDNQLPEVSIQDFPAVRFRGVVEGFYGTPWSHQARLRQLKFYGENKMNTYIYGPKDDPYHSSPNWRLPYPEQEALQLQELVKVANENEVNFVWAIHPGQDIKWNEADRKQLLAKFESMYQLGVRSFAVFFDDISGEGTNPTRQAELMNYLDEQFVKVKADVTPLIMCPTEYNKSWANPAKGYLPTLGEKLNQSVQIMWTGDRVVSSITKEGIDWINGYIKRPAYIWWNFPVSDFVRDRLLLGAVYGNDTDIADKMSGFVSNPMEHAEASKIAIYAVAAYAWNPTNYNSDEVWKQAIQVILPSAAAELLLFAEHNSALGANGHKYDREESVRLQQVAKRFIDSYSEKNYQENDFAALQQEFENMIAAADILSINTENQPLIEELTPWLVQFKLVGETGSEVLELAKAYNDGQQAVFLSKYRHIKALQQRMFYVNQTLNQNSSQPGVKTATQVIKPLIDRTFALTTQRYNEKYGTQLDITTDYMPHTLSSNVEQLRNQPLQVKTNRILISPLNEVVKLAAGATVSIELDKAYPGKAIDFDLGKPEVAAWGKLEVSTDGKNWTPVSFTQNKNKATANISNTQVKAVRFANGGSAEQEVYLRQFVVSVAK